MKAQDVQLLVQCAQQGSQAAFTELYNAHVRLVRSVHCQIFREHPPIDMDDFTQEVFMLAFTRLHLFEGGSTFSTWLTRIAKNQAFMAYRKWKMVTKGDCNLMQLQTVDEEGSKYSHDVEDPRADTLGWILSNEAIERIERVAGQTPKHLVILDMQINDEMSMKEIANHLGISEAATKSRIYHARESLRKRLLAEQTI